MAYPFDSDSVTSLLESINANVVLSLNYLSSIDTLSNTTASVLASCSVDNGNSNEIRTSVIP